MKELSGHLQEQMASISDLQEESAALGRTVRSLQAWLVYGDAWHMAGLDLYAEYPV